MPRLAADPGCSPRPSAPCSDQAQVTRRDRQALHAVLKRVLGEAPQYNAAHQDAFAYLQQLLQWGAPAGATLGSCIIQDTDGIEGGQAKADLTVAHAAGCFPHTWAVPLEAAAVQAANKARVAAWESDPKAVVEEALRLGLPPRGNQKQPASTGGRWNAADTVRKASGSSGAAAGGSSRQGLAASTEPAPPFAAAAAAAAPAARLVRSRSQAAPAAAAAAPAQQHQQRKASGDRPKQVAAAPAAAAEVPPASGRWKWTMDSEGWLRCSLNATACHKHRRKLGLPGAPLPRCSWLGCQLQIEPQDHTKQIIWMTLLVRGSHTCCSTNPRQLFVAARVFEKLTGEAATDKTTKVEALDEPSRKSYALPYCSEPSSGSHYLQARLMAATLDRARAFAWLASSSASCQHAGIPCHTLRCHTLLCLSANHAGRRFRTVDRRQCSSGGRCDCLQAAGQRQAGQAAGAAHSGGRGGRGGSLARLQEAAAQQRDRCRLPIPGPLCCGAGAAAAGKAAEGCAGGRGTAARGGAFGMPHRRCGTTVWHTHGGPQQASKGASQLHLAIFGHILHCPALFGSADPPCSVLPRLVLQCTGRMIVHGILAQWCRSSLTGRSLPTFLLQLCHGLLCSGGAAACRSVPLSALLRAEHSSNPRSLVTPMPHICATLLCSAGGTRFSTMTEMSGPRSWCREAATPSGGWSRRAGRRSSMGAASRARLRRGASGHRPSSRRSRRVGGAWPCQLSWVGVCRCRQSSLPARSSGEMGRQRHRPRGLPASRQRRSSSAHPSGSLLRCSCWWGAALSWTCKPVGRPVGLPWQLHTG